ncbi:hypothetical protein QR680_012119 [Steinernema hermaphroditum]|uniref:Uncharacterized protein n=1 Tax=Steinernema hermaphroditum TaxID=289476 RepID=A0AA39M078_9BILA|nr:hypothetical protein QR680_012119 [Steinernema hermaphroditum]
MSTKLLSDVFNTEALTGCLPRPVYHPYSPVNQASDTPIDFHLCQPVGNMTFVCPEEARRETQCTVFKSGVYGTRTAHGNLYPGDFNEQKVDLDLDEQLEQALLVESNISNSSWTCDCFVRCKT